MRGHGTGQHVRRWGSSQRNTPCPNNFSVETIPGHALRPHSDRSKQPQRCAKSKTKTLSASRQWISLCCPPAVQLPMGNSCPMLYPYTLQAITRRTSFICAFILAGRMCRNQLSFPGVHSLQKGNKPDTQVFRWNGWHHNHGVRSSDHS